MPHILVVLLLLGGWFGPQSVDVEFTFIGNMAFKISDGRTTLFSDFPYRSGASGYMTYDIDSIGEVAEGVSLITHEHADHWDPTLFETMGWRIVAAPPITRDLDAAAVIPWSDRITYRDIVIEPGKTEHTGAHHSYLVTWHGLRLYFSGDTEGTTDLLAQTDLDVAFVSPWLAERIAVSEATIDARRIVIYHHRPGERRRMPSGAILMEQGESFRITGS